MSLSRSLTRKRPKYEASSVIFKLVFVMGNSCGEGGPGSADQGASHRTRDRFSALTITPRAPNRQLPTSERLHLFRARQRRGGRLDTLIHIAASRVRLTAAKSSGRHPDTLP